MHFALPNNLLMHNGPEKRPCGLDCAPEADRRRRNWVTDDELVRLWRGLLVWANWPFGFAGVWVYKPRNGKPQYEKAIYCLLFV